MASKKKCVITYRLAPLLLILLALAGCGQDPAQAIIGRWEDERGIVEVFAANHVYFQPGSNGFGCWTVKDGVLTIYSALPGPPMSNSYAILISSDTLQASGVIDFIRKRVSTDGEMNEAERLAFEAYSREKQMIPCTDFLE